MTQLKSLDYRFDMIIKTFEDDSVEREFFDSSNEMFDRLFELQNQVNK
jgi:hypothetical protein